MSSAVLLLPLFIPPRHDVHRVREGHARWYVPSSVTRLIHALCRVRVRVRVRGHPFTHPNVLHPPASDTPSASQSRGTHPDVVQHLPCCHADVCLGLVHALRRVWCVCPVSLSLSENVRNQAIISSIAKPCPGCGSPVEKSGTLTPTLTLTSTPHPCLLVESSRTASARFALWPALLTLVSVFRCSRARLPSKWPPAGGCNQVSVSAKRSLLSHASPCLTVLLPSPRAPLHPPHAYDDTR